MKTLKERWLFIYLVLIALILSCNSLNKNEMETLQNKNFYFQRFILSRKGINEKLAFKTMKSLPVEKVLAMLAHKYNISIDSTEFDNIINTETAPQFKDDMMPGILRKEYEWESSTKNPNNIELSYYFLLGDRGVKEAQKFSIIINVNGKKKEAIYGDIYEDLTTFEYIAKNLDYSRVNPKSDDVYINNKNKTQIDFTKVGIKAQATTPDINVKDKNKLVSEESIKQDIKKYINKMPATNKKKFRDNIIKFLYSEIE